MFLALGCAVVVLAYAFTGGLPDRADAAVRPLTPVYQNLSTITSKVLSPPADIDPQKTASRLRSELQKALESKGVLP